MSVSNAPHPALRPDDILDAAIAEFLSRGYADTEMHHIAGRMQVPVGAVALYFETPQDMLEALVSQTSAKIAKAAERFTARHAEKDPEGSLRSIFRMIFTTIADPDVSAAQLVVMSEGLRRPEIASHYREQVINIGKAALETCVQTGVQQGYFRPIDPEAVCRAFVGPAILQLFMNTVFYKPGDPELCATRMSDELSDLLLAGLKG